MEKLICDILLDLDCALQETNIFKIRPRECGFKKTVIRDMRDLLFKFNMLSIGRITFLG